MKSSIVLLAAVQMVVLFDATLGTGLPTMDESGLGDPLSGLSDEESAYLLDSWKQQSEYFMESGGWGQNDGDMEDAHLNFVQLVTKYGYQVEQYEIETKDGYLLTVHRIPPKEGCTPERQMPVLLQHGLLCSSDDWITPGPEKALAYLLSNECYDVWLGNSRGNKYSRKHAYLSVDSDEYWNFSWHEMGLYDLPALIDFVLQEAGAPQLFYVGYSMGTTQYIAMDTMIPEYAGKVKLAVALAPIVFMGHSKSYLLKLIAKFEGPLGLLLKVIGFHNFFPGNGLVNDIGEQCNAENGGFQKGCEYLLFAIVGYDKPQMNDTLLPVLLAHTPAGAAVNVLRHYGQLLNTGKFVNFDHGPLENVKRYGEIFPPSYNLSNAKSSYVLFYSHNDLLGNVKDVEMLIERLPNRPRAHLVQWEAWNHLDHIWGIDIYKYVNEPVIKVINDASSE